MDSTWLSELDKYLNCEENKLKEHKVFVNYQYDWLDKSFPSVEAAHDLLSAPVAPPKPQY